MEHIRNCRVCGKIIARNSAQPHSHYCSTACRAAWRATHDPIKAPSINKSCPHCGKEFDTKRHWRRFCSTKCQLAAYNARRNQENNYDAYHQLRFSILARDGFRCRYCGRSAQEDGVKLQVDHIIPKDKNGSDEQSNLITACQDCNIGKGSLLLLIKAGQIPSYLTIESLTKLPGKC